MAEKFMRTGQVEVEVDSRIRSSTVAQSAQEAPGGLYPMQTRAFEIDEWRIRNGWPVAVPAYDIRSETLISASGETFTSRNDSTGVTTGAMLRWIAEPDYYDETALRWVPFQDSTGSGVVWETSAEYAPVLISDYEYRVKNERFYVNALNFDSDTRNHMWADFEASIGGSQGYTVIMVMSPNSSYGNNVDVPYNGIWCPGRPTPFGTEFTEETDPTWLSVTMQGGHLYLASESKSSTRAISISPELNSNAPTFLAMVFGRPETVFYVGPGPGSIRVQSVDTGSEHGLMDSGTLLGRSTGDVLHTADMALMDLGIYANRLSATEIQSEFALLSSVYGGNE